MHGEALRELAAVQEAAARAMAEAADLRRQNERLQQQVRRASAHHELIIMNHELIIIN